MQRTDLRDRRAALGEVRDHLRRDLARKGRDALVGYPVVPRENRDHRVVERRLGLALPARKVLDESFEHAQRPRGLG
jgi:hypothetical protein